MEIAIKNTSASRLNKLAKCSASVASALLLSLHAPYTFAALSDFVKDANTGCTIHNFAEGKVKLAWSGACVEGKISGTGVLTINYVANNETCTQTGEYKNGLKHGFVKSLCPDGSSLEGAFTNGVLTGKSVDTGPDGDRWEWDFRDALFNGKGTHTLAKLPNYKYQGEFKDSKYHGQGVQSFPDGEKRVGEFIENQILKGLATYPNKTKYEGEFKNGMPHGNGRFTYEFGTTYTGEFENGSFHGAGRLIYVHGDYQIGLFKNGKFITGTEKYSGSLADHKRAALELKLEKKMQNIDAWNDSVNTMFNGLNRGCNGAECRNK
jgi:hypothetical protein